MIAAGAGKNPKNPGDTGWNAAWNENLPADSQALALAVQCSKTYQTWTAGNDNLAMNCVDWFLAEAFCAWDGGRLPTEAEWNYAAAGGAEQRVYPWGSAPPDSSHAVANVMSVAPVGSKSPAGDGKWGNSDLAGNLNEWIQDWSRDLPLPCNDCASPGPSDTRVRRGGSFDNIESSSFSSAIRSSSTPDIYKFDVGIRCARGI